MNAGTTEKDYAWIRKHVGALPGVHISDYSPYYSQLAVQGPRSLDTLKKLTSVDLAAIKNYWFTWGTVAGIPNVLIARTGYSGEDGFEVYTPSDEATTREDVECADGGGRGVRHPAMRPGRAQYAAPGGGNEPLRARDLRGDQRSRGGLDRWLKLDKGAFIGRDALLAVQESGGPKRKVVGLEMVDRGIARDGYPVLDLEGREIGVVTSGSPAPFLKTNIAMALVPAEVAASGSDVLVQVRANQVRAKQVPLPFYKRPKK